MDPVLSDYIHASETAATTFEKILVRVGHGRFVGPSRDGMDSEELEMVLEKRMMKIQLLEEIFESFFTVSFAFWDECRLGSIFIQKRSLCPNFSSIS